MFLFKSYFYNYKPIHDIDIFNTLPTPTHTHENWRSPIFVIVGQNIQITQVNNKIVWNLVWSNFRN